MNTFLNKMFIYILGIFLTISIGGNIYQHFKCKQEPIIETVIVRDTTTVFDTIVVSEIQEVIIEKPIPVEIIDTVENIKIYRDTIFHKYGWILGEELVRGDLLSQRFRYQLDIPTYYRTRTITNTITNTIRNNLFYITGGFNYNFADQGFYPSIGATYIWNNQKRIISLEYSLDKRIDLNVGFNLWR